MDIDLTPAGVNANVNVALSELAQAGFVGPSDASAPAGFLMPKDGSPQDPAPDPSKKEEGLPAEELMKRQERLKKKGAQIRSILGKGAKYVIDCDEYRRKKVKVFVQYEGFQPGAIDTRLELRVGITLPDKWVDAPAYKLKKTFLKTYNDRHKKAPIEADKCLLAKNDLSYLSFSKDIIADDRLIGDAFCENEEIFVVTEADVEELDAEVDKLKKIIEDYEQEAHANATIDAMKVVDMTTVSREIDPFQPHCLLVGMKQMYMLPILPTYTVADIKYFIHYKGGPDAFPMGSIDIAVVENFEINVLGDDATMESLAKRVYGDDCTLTEEGERKVAVPLYWGKRLQDPKYFIWIPTLHTPDSFRGPGDDAPAGPKTGAEMAQEMANSGGECSVM